MIGYVDTVGRITAIQTQLAALQNAFTPPSTATAAAPSTSVAAPASSPTTSTGSFSAQLATALAPPGTASGVTAYNPSGGVTLTGGALPAQASSLLTSDQQQFASRLAADTGMDPGVVSAWLLAEESGGAASSRQGASNNDWLNIGYTDSGTYGAGGAEWSNPLTAADATAGWLKGQSTIPGYGTASSGIQAILATAGQPAATQISAIQNSGWASSGYPDLPGLYQQVAG